MSEILFGTLGLAAMLIIMGLASADASKTLKHLGLFFMLSWAICWIAALVYFEKPIHDTLASGGLVLLFLGFVAYIAGKG